MPRISERRTGPEEGGPEQDRAVHRLPACRSLDKLLNQHGFTPLHEGMEQADLLNHWLWGKLLARVVQFGAGPGHLDLDPLGGTLVPALAAYVLDLDQPALLQIRKLAILIG